MIEPIIKYQDASRHQLLMAEQFNTNSVTDYIVTRAMDPFGNGGIATCPPLRQTVPY